MYYFVVFFIAYALGIIFCVYFNFLYILAAAIAFAIINSILNKKLMFNLLIILFIILSFVTINYNSKSVLIQYLNSDVEIIANILSIKSKNEDSKYIGYNAYVTSVNGIKIKEKTIFYVPKEKVIESNSIIQTNATVSEILSNKNKTLFNYKNSLKSNGIFVTMFYKSELKVIENNYSLLNEISIVCKKKIENLFRRFMSEENANTVLSVVLGDTKYLDKDYYKDIQKTGLAHVFAVSGLHIVIIYTAFLKVFSLLGISRRISWFLSWCLLWVYGFIIGFPVTVLRSLLMFNFLFGSEFLYRKYNSINSLIVSALILLIVNPYYLFDVGFQLSYMAALCLVVYNQVIKVKLNIKNEILNNLILYVFVQIFTLPIMSYYFNYVSVIGIIFNLLIVPLFSGIIIFAFAVIPISFMSIYTVVIPLKLLDFMLNSVNYAINIGSNLNITGFEIGSMSVISGIYYYIFIAMFIYFLRFEKLQYKRFILFAVSVIYSIDLIVVPASFKGLNLNIVDVGQGLFINLNYDKYNFIFDAGSNNDYIGKYVTAPYLIKHGRKNVDSIFISHFHTDHYSGVNDIINSCKVKNIFSSSNKGKELINKEYTILNSKHRFNLENNFKIKILWPDKDYLSSNENNMSNVYLIEYEDIKILITGDIEKEVEDLILERLEDVNIVIVPHHGSKTSSTESFVNKINPEIAIFSYGKNNYGIPAQEVLNRYSAAGSKNLSTFDDGEINVMVIKDKIYYNTYTGNHSENINDIYLYNFLLNLVSFIMIIYTAWFYKSYINDAEFKKLLS